MLARRERGYVRTTHVVYTYFNTPIRVFNTFAEEHFYVRNCICLLTE